MVTVMTTIMAKDVAAAVVEGRASATQLATRGVEQRGRIKLIYQGYQPYG